ncbi:MAG: nuclear transport factor 2 family protein [Candidatus Poribacteria bacterium]|nr:nuclear transport factor 2 family protein [Candidatus Poribacteria bacterium]
MPPRNLTDAYRTVTEYFDALVSGDIERLAVMMSSAEFYVKIGTDAEEVIEGGENALDYYRHHAASTEDFSIGWEKLDVQERDNVAWFYTRQRWCLKWCGIREELGMRMTGVLEKEGKCWRFVQIHASVGVPVK